MTPSNEPLGSLTPNQLSELEHYSAAWLDLRYVSCDRSKVSQAVESVYHTIGFEAPYMIWCQSLWQLAVVPAITHLVLLDHDGRLRAELSERLVDPLWRRMWESLEPQVSSIVSGSRTGWQHSRKGGVRSHHDRVPTDFLGNNIRLSLLVSLDRVLCQAESAISKTVSHRLKNSLRETLYLRDSGFAVDGRLPAASLVRSQLEAELNAILRRRPEIQFLSQLSESGRAIVDELLEPLGILREVKKISTLGTLLLETNGAILWPTLIEWLPLYAFIRDCLPVSVDYQCANSQIDAWLACKKYTLALACFGGFAFVCEMPLKLHFDRTGVLHREDGPAFEFVDGHRGYAWRGVRVPGYVIEEPTSITPSLIDTQPNVEVRRIMLERYGVERYVKESNTVKLHQDEFGILYRREFNDDEHIVFVRVQNRTAETDGSFKEFFLRVPPHITSARAGVAWTFGLRAEEYHPRIES